MLRRDLIAVSRHLKKVLEKQRATFWGMQWQDIALWQMVVIWRRVSSGSEQGKAVLSRETLASPSWETFRSSMQHDLALNLPLPEQELGPCTPWNPSNLIFSLNLLIFACVEPGSTEYLATLELLKPISCSWSCCQEEGRLSGYSYDNWLFPQIQSSFLFNTRRDPAFQAVWRSCLASLPPSSAGRSCQILSQSSCLVFGAGPLCWGSWAHTSLTARHLHSAQTVQGSALHSLQLFFSAASHKTRCSITVLISVTVQGWPFLVSFFSPSLCIPGLTSAFLLQSDSDSRVTFLAVRWSVIFSLLSVPVFMPSPTLPSWAVPMQLLVGLSYQWYWCNKHFQK